MGYNTTVVFFNDTIDRLEDDPEAGKRIFDAIRQCARVSNDDTRNERRNIYGNGCQLGKVIEQHHSGGQMVVAVGGNTGQVLGYGGSYAADKEQILRTLAREMGYTLRKIPEKKK